MKDLIKNTIVLFIITLVAGFALGAVYDITKEPRAKQELEATNNAYKEVFSNASDFETTDINLEDAAEYIEEAGITLSQAEVTTVVTALDNSGNPLGYVFTVTSKEGYGGDVIFTVGIQNDGTTNGISILTINETAGLGMQASSDKFKSQFANKNVDKFTYTKDGATTDDEIDAISGATITTSTVTNGVNAALYCFDYITGGDQNE